MTEKEKTTGILRHYFELEHDISNFEIVNIQNNMIKVSFIATGKEFIDPYIEILGVNFESSEIVGNIDISLAKMYVKDKVDEVELFE